MISFEIYKGKTYVLFKGTVKQLDEFVMYIRTYPKNTTVLEYVKKEMNK